MNSREIYESWLKEPNLNEELRKELLAYDDATIEDAFYKNLEFGTAGMRGVLGAGTNRLNIYVVEKATLGFGNYLLNKYQHEAQERGVVIGCDNRYHSSEFSLMCAKVLASIGIKVYLFEGLRPTPEISFAIRELHAVGGIILTASHNPKEYNGYKIYDKTGAQVLPEEVNHVIHEISLVKNMFEIETEKNPENIVMIGKHMDDIYLENVRKIQLHPEVKKDTEKFVYTPLHGTGSVFASQFLNSLGYNVTPVASQMVNDPAFGAVESANPEEHKAFKQAIELAKQIGANTALATDPDADRLGVVVRHNGEFVYLNGNQTASIIMYYIAKNRKDLENGCMYGSVVSSSLPFVIAQSAGLETHTVLTGFKYIGAECEKLIGTNKKYIFGFEESYGCLLSDFVRDKDGIQAITILCEMTCYYKEKGMDLIDVLQQIYKEYGYYLEFTDNQFFRGENGTKAMNELLDSFRNKGLRLNCMDITSVEDYKKGVKTNSDGSTEEITLPKTNMIRYLDSKGSWVILRPSGTEPKLKIYYGVKGETLEEATKTLDAARAEMKTKLM